MPCHVHACSQGSSRSCWNKIQDELYTLCITLDEVTPGRLSCPRTALPACSSPLLAWALICYPATACLLHLLPFYCLPACSTSLATLLLPACPPPAHIHTYLRWHSLATSCGSTRKSSIPTMRVTFLLPWRFSTLTCTEGGAPLRTACLCPRVSLHAYAAHTVQ